MKICMHVYMYMQHEMGWGRLMPPSSHGCRTKRWVSVSANSLPRPVNSLTRCPFKVKTNTQTVFYVDALQNEGHSGIPRHLQMYASPSYYSWFWSEVLCKSIWSKLLPHLPDVLLFPGLGSWSTTPQAPPMLAMQREIAMIQASSDQKSKVFVAKTHFPLLNLETD